MVVVSFEGAIETFADGRFTSGVRVEAIVGRTIGGALVASSRDGPSSALSSKSKKS